MTGIIGRSRGAAVRLKDNVFTVALQPAKLSGGTALKPPERSMTPAEIHGLKNALTRYIDQPGTQRNQAQYVYLRDQLAASKLRVAVRP